MIAPRISAGLDADEPVAALRVGRGAACPREIRIERRRVLLALVAVTTARIGLPDFHERVGDRPPILVEHAPVHDDTLADRLARMLAGEIVVAGTKAVVTVERTGELGRGVRDQDRLVLWRAFHRALVVGVERGRETLQARPRIGQSHVTPFVLVTAAGAQATRSSASDAPWPTPTHSVASPNLPPVFSR